MDADKLAVTPEDEALASRFWRIHPDELVEMGTYREEFYAREIAKHRIASEQAAARRALEMAAEVAMNTMVLLDMGRPDEGPFTRDDRAVDTTKAAIRTAILAINPSEGTEP